jgi:alkanesulfonate monooxygenase SsuD/methylene tetrahydromethanopterin reductase-like flavin-dependent oxidoreductase (luciferase family)
MKLSLKLNGVGFPTDLSMIRDMTQAADALGLHAVYVSDHLVRPGFARTGATGEPHLEALALLAYLAADTRLRLGANVLVVGHRHPALLAKAISTLDVLCNGRLIVGIGTGGTRIGTDLVGSIPPGRSRGGALEEAVEICRGLWSGRTFAYQGDHWSIPPTVMSPCPVQVPGPPIHIGGRSTNAAVRAARFGDGWAPVDLSPREMEAALGVLARTARSERRNLSELHVSHGVLVDLAAEAGYSAVDGMKVSNRLGGPPAFVVDEFVRFGELGVTETILDLRLSPLSRLLADIERVAREFSSRRPIPARVGDTGNSTVPT